MIKIDENDPIGEVDPSFPYRDVVIRKNTDMKEFYDLQKEIGRGKFGTVYRCTEKSTGLKLAAKFIGISKRQDRRNAEREVEIMRELQHPRLIQMYDAFEINNIMCVVLELIEGGELFERVIDDDFILTEKSVSVFMRQICEGIAFIHSKNILHLDMKPENILCLTRTGNRIKIIDFGLARKYDPEKKLQVLFGTPEFVAPEVVNFDSIGFGTDMWSVGVICYVLLSGLSPFMGETDVQTMANVTIAQYDFDDEAFNDISADAKDFIGKLLLKDRERRMSATECLSHRWLQRRKPPDSGAPPSNPIPQSELDLQRDTLRYLVDRWNNDTNIALVVNNDDDKCDKVIDICKTNGIIEQQSKSQNELVSKSSSINANDISAIQRNPPSGNETASKPVNFENNATLVPIQSVETPQVPNEGLKPLPDVTKSIDKPTAPNLKRSLNIDVLKDESNSEKEQSCKISKTPSASSRSGSSSPVINIEKPTLNGESTNINDQYGQELPKQRLLEVPRKSPQKHPSDVKKSPSTSPKTSKKTVSKTPSPSINDQQADTVDKSSQKLPKSPSLLEIPKKLPQMESVNDQKSPSVSPKPSKKPGTSKTPSPSIKDRQSDHEDEPANVQEEITVDKSSQKLSKSLSLLEVPRNVSTTMESAGIQKSPPTTLKTWKKTVVKTPSPTIEDPVLDHQNESIYNQVENIKEKCNSELPKISTLEVSKKSIPSEITNMKKSPSTSPIPLKKKPASKSPSPSIQDQSDHGVDVDTKVIQSVTPEKSPQRDISNGKKSSATVLQTISAGNSVDIGTSKSQQNVVSKSSTETNSKICDKVKETLNVDKTSLSINTNGYDSTITRSSSTIQGTSGKSNTNSDAIRDTRNIRTSTPGAESIAQGIGKEDTKSKDKLHDIPSTNATSQPQLIHAPIVEISDETYEYVKKRRFTIKSVTEQAKTVETDDSTTRTKSSEKSTSFETMNSPSQPARRSIFSPDVSPKVLRKLNDFVSTSELMKRRISDISNLLSRTEDSSEQSIPGTDMSSFCSKLNRIVRLRHDSYSMDGSSNLKRPKFRISYLSRDVPLASTPPLHADLLNYLPLGDESLTTSGLWSFQRTNPFHSDPSSLRNSPERFGSPSLTKKLLSKFFNDSLEYDISSSSTPSTSTNGLPKDKITGIIS